MQRHITKTKTKKNKTQSLKKRNKTLQNKFRQRAKKSLTKRRLDKTKLASLKKTFKTLTKKLNKKNVKKTVPHPTKSNYRKLAILSISVFALIGTIFYFYILKDLPSPGKLSTTPYPISTYILDRHGKLLFEIFTDERRDPITLAELPDYVKNSTIAIEDRNFYQHHGLSYSGISRALFNNIQYLFCHLTKNNCQLSFQGGSTITQQLVKNVLLTPERTVRRKIKEALLTIIVEQKYTKDEILEMYLNHVPYGGTAYGIESASQTYFNKPAKKLSIAEATILAGLPQAPTKFSPYGVDPQAYKNRQKTVIRRMVEDGYITPSQAQKIINTKVEFASPSNLIYAPHFVLWVKSLLVEKYGQKTVEQGGLRVTTTLDLDLQKFAQENIKNEIAKLKNYHVSNGAALVTHPSTGQILAMIGSADYFNKKNDGNVNLVLSRRQPGSSIKPLNYALGIENYNIFSSSIIADIPTCFSVTGQSLYCPENYDGQFHGPVQARYALSNSYNIPAVRVLAKNGIDSFITTASAMGITGWKDRSKYGLSLTLGGGDVRMIDMAVAYGVLANYGQKVNLNPILEVKNHLGKTLEQAKCQPSPTITPSDKTNKQKEFTIPYTLCNSQPVISPETAYIITNILSDSQARAATFGNSLNVPNHPEVAVKTGTTNDLRDNWTIGYSPDVLVATWVGNFDNSPMSHIASGITGAAPIWKNIINHALNDKKQRADLSQHLLDNSLQKFNLKEQPTLQWIKPDNVINLPVCVESGLSVSPDTNQPCTPRPEIFIKGHIPQHHTKDKRPWPIDKTTGRPAIDRTPPENIEMQNHLIYFDILGTALCLDCPPPIDPVIIKYPLKN